MKKIKITGGYEAIVDKEDYNRLSKINWYYQKIGKHTYVRCQNKDGKFIYMHRAIMNHPKGLLVDHINRNGLDNRKDNLRLCTKSQNGCNRGKDRDNSSGYKGVSYITNKQPRKKRWMAQIAANKKHICIGYFDTAREAALAWNKAAKKYHGEFAYQNNI